LGTSHQSGGGVGFEASGVFGLLLVSTGLDDFNVPFSSSKPDSTSSMQLSSAPSRVSSFVTN
jgi:hypothetical protein